MSNNNFNKFTTPYLKTVKGDKLDEESFAKYVVNSLL